MKLFNKKIYGILGLLIFAISSFLISPAQAATIYKATGFIHDVDGKPVAGVGLLVQSSVTGSSQHLEVFATSDALGKFSAQSYSDYVVSLRSDRGTKNLAKYPPITGTLSQVNRSIDITVPKERTIYYDVRSASGDPIMGVQTDIFPRILDGGFSTSFTAKFTDFEGKAAHGSFVGGTINPSQYEGKAGIVHYTPFEGVQLTKWVEDSDLADDQISIVLDDVPSVSFQAPSTSKTSGFDLSATVLGADGTTSVAQSIPRIATIGIAVARSEFKRVDLMKRSYVKGKWTAWTKQIRVNVTNAGVAKFGKIKLAKAKYQFRVLGVGFSLGSPVRTVTVK